jgi:hypothetical protein
MQDEDLVSVGSFQLLTQHDQFAPYPAFDSPNRNPEVNCNLGMCSAINEGKDQARPTSRLERLEAVQQVGVIGRPVC